MAYSWISAAEEAAWVRFLRVVGELPRGLAIHDARGRRGRQLVMQHLTVFFFTLSLATACAAVIITAQAYRRHGFDFLRWFLYFVIGLNLGLLVDFLFAYLSANLAEQITPGLARVISAAGRIVEMVIMLGVYFSVLQSSRTLVAEKLSRRSKQILAAVSVLVILVFAVSIDSLLSVEGIQIHSWINGLFNLFGHLFCIGVLVHLILKARRVERPAQRAALVIAARIYLTLIVALLGLDLLYAFDAIPVDQFGLATSLFYIAFNLVPVFLLGKFIRRVFVEEARLPPAEIDLRDFGALCERFGITHREREIIELICQGKANKEIADRLYIEVQSVKDHNYRIFRKLKVQSRMQVARLFLGSATRDAESADVD
ncbi:MAG: helix-turn-helix transcriptional regulator [Phycisphaerales bacterium]|nr:MAG: helix-turn-helix transcriptional regulator [Phycisphaerales bacterium]